MEKAKAFDTTIQESDSVDVHPLLAPGGPLVVLLADESGAVFATAVQEVPEGEASRDFFESVVLFAVDMAFSKHAAAQGWASEPVLRGISKGSYRMELQVCLEDNLPSDCTGKAACQAVGREYLHADGLPDDYIRRHSGAGLSQSLCDEAWRVLLHPV